MLDLAQVGEYFDTHFSRTAFRLEALDVYDVSTDGGDVERYLRGEPEPDPGRKQPWLDHLRAEREAGKHRSRVHVWRSPLNDYLRYECEWGYVPNAAAGEDIRILDLAETPQPDGLIVREFWLFDDRDVLLMHYDDQGRFVGGEPLDERETPKYRDAAQAAVDASIPFTDWWANHPSEHRKNWAA